MATTARFAAAAQAASAAPTAAGGGGGGGGAGVGTTASTGNSNPPTPAPATSPPAQAQTTQLIVLPASLHQVLVNLTCITTLLPLLLTLSYPVLFFFLHYLSLSSLLRSVFPLSTPSVTLHYTNLLISLLFYLFVYLFIFGSLFSVLFLFCPSSQVQVVRW